MIEADVLALLRQHLPPYLVPAQLLAVESVPVSAHGKVDREALLLTIASRIAASDPAQPCQQVDYRDDLERDLGAMWTELTGTPEIARDRSLLDCGANSITAFSALHEIKKLTGVEVSIIDFFRSPTIADLARWIREATEASGAA